MTFSLNNRLILEQYIKEGLKSKIIGGIATPGQRDGLKGLKILVSAKLADGRDVPAGSIAFIREETLFTQAWANKPLTCATLSIPFIVAEMGCIEFIETPDTPDDAA